MAKNTKTTKDDAEDLIGGGIEGGHNAQTVAAGQLRAFLERLERLAEEKKVVADDMKDVMAEAKGVGFDTKAIRTILKLRKMDQAQRQEEEAIVDLYKSALGME